MGLVLLAPTTTFELNFSLVGGVGIGAVCVQVPGPPVVEGVKISALPVNGSGEEYSPPMVKTFQRGPARVVFWHPSPVFF